MNAKKRIARHRQAVKDLVARGCAPIPLGAGWRTNAAYAEVVWSHIWRDHGFPAFEVAEDVAVELADTDLGNVLGRDLCLPFPAFIVSLQGARSPLFSDGRMLRDVRVLHEANGLVIFMDEGAPQSVVPDETVWAYEEQRYPGPDEPLSSWSEQAETRRAFQLVVGLILGFNEVRAGRSGAELAVSRKAPKHWRISTDRRIGKAHDVSPGSTSGHQYAVGRRFCVRAHWRRQRVGKGLQDVRLVRVREHWRGPEDAPEVHPTYH